MYSMISFILQGQQHITCCERRVRTSGGGGHGCDDGEKRGGVGVAVMMKRIPHRGMSMSLWEPQYTQRGTTLRCVEPQKPQWAGTRALCVRAAIPLRSISS